ncbi:MAG: alpha-amylase, partial [Flavobacteriales bacterium]|nr:alpha-amylase [Flavobacteriales bacterium]
ALDAKKDGFMLAEAETPELHEKAFDMTYSWELMHIMNGLADQSKTMDDLHNYMLKEDTNFHKNDYRMNFITNHDENSWNGTVFERYGDAHKTYATLAATINGMPLVYSGQEAGMDKRLKFFEKDTVEWGDYIYQDFYSQLYKINKEEEALWNGHYGGDYERLNVDSEARVFAFKREKNESTVVTVVNLDSIPASFSITSPIAEELTYINGPEVLNDQAKTDIQLGAYGHRIYVKKRD